MNMPRNRQLGLLAAAKEAEVEPRPESSRLNLDLDAIRDKSYLTHNFHPYSAKFIPQIPAAIMDEYAKPGSIVLDPFCGSGTVAVEAVLRGHRCYASDTNPIATLITRAKVSHLTSRDELQIQDLLIALRKDNRGSSVPRPAFKNLSHWFTTRMTDELATIRQAISSLPTSSAAHTLALTAFSAIIVRCSRQDSETRWVAVQKSFPAHYALCSFEARLVDMSRRSRELSEKAAGQAYVFDADARNLHYASYEFADLVVTSPPYLNSYDYYLYHKLRMFWLGYDHFAVQEAEIGSRHRHCDKKESTNGYVSAMSACFKELRRVLKPGGVAAVVIGDSIYQGELVDMGKVYEDLAKAYSFILVERFDYDQRKYTRAFGRNFKKLHKRTHILVFSKA